MPRCHAIFFEEPVQLLFPGFWNRITVRDFPLWGNFIVRDVLALSDHTFVPHDTISVGEPQDLERVFNSLKDLRASDTLIIGRTGNVTAPDWREICTTTYPDGINKLHIGKSPSELYVLSKRRFERIVREIDASISWTRDSFSRFLFDEFFFHHFDRIIDVSGHSYLLRNAAEYFRENLNLLSYLRDRDFLELYGRLEQGNTSKVVIDVSGVVRDSILGAGSRVRGTVENSLIFHNVYVAREAHVRNCVVLPFNVVEEGAVLEHALVLGGKDGAIERNVRIGGTDAVPNAEYPQVLKNGLTVIGQGMTIPRGSTIGEGCLVHGKMEKRLSAPLHLEKGDSYLAR
jgi:hypothetical protein